MKIRIAINGFGRIGRNALKIAHGRNDIEVVAINDLADNDTLAHLLKHDSNYPSYEWCKSVQATSNGIIVDGKGIYSFSEKDPAKLPWKQLNVDVVIESTGFFTSVNAASAHIKAGAKRVVISAPLSGDGKTIVLGVNDDKISEITDVVANASCTTNCVAPVLSILSQTIGVKKSMMSTVHSYTASQRLQDAPAPNLREARNAATNIIPSTTGASKAVAAVLPSAKGRFGGLSVRVPTPVVSLVDLTFVAERATSAEEINKIFEDAANEPFYQGIVGVSNQPLVSSDYIGNSHSATVDLSLTEVVDGDLVRVVAWYDNEWGYSNRLVELTADVGRYAQEDARRSFSASSKARASQPDAQPAQSTQPASEQSANQQNENQSQNSNSGNDQGSNKKKRNRNKNKNQNPDPALSLSADQSQSHNQNQNSANNQNNQEVEPAKIEVEAAAPPTQNVTAAPTQPEPQPEEPASQANEPDNDIAAQENLAEKLIAIEGTDHLN